MATQRYRSFCKKENSKHTPSIDKNVLQNFAEFYSSHVEKSGGQFLIDPAWQNKCGGRAPGRKRIVSSSKWPNSMNSINSIELNDEIVDLSREDLEVDDIGEVVDLCEDVQEDDADPADEAASSEKMRSTSEPTSSWTLEEKVEAILLMQLGLSRSLVERTLQSAGGDLQKAASMVLSLTR
jgi:hypothetical protein